MSSRQHHFTNTLQDANMPVDLSSFEIDYERPISAWRVPDE